MKEKDIKKKKNFSNVLILVGIAIIVLASYQLVNIFLEYKKIDDQYEEILEKVVISSESNTEESTTESSESVFSIDFGSLLKINEDIVGWIRFDQPDRISYPIAQGESNDEYIRTDLYGNYSTAGTIFIDSVNNGDFSDRNTFIYGHNMRNGSMFGMLKMYKDSDFYSQYPYFYIYTPDGEVQTYEIFAVCIVQTTSESYTYWFADDSVFEDYISYERSVSLYQTDVEVTCDSKIVSLSTCTNGDDNERLLIHAVLLEE